MAGSNPISLSEIFAYFQIAGIDDIEERRDYIDFIKALDRVYLKHEAKETEKEMKRQKAAQKAKK